MQILLDLIDFGYGLSDTQDGLRCWRTGIYLLWITSSPHDNVSGERSRTLGHSCLMNRTLLSNSKASHDQLVKLLINLEAHIFIFKSNCVSNCDLWYPGSGVVLDCIDS